MAHLRSNVVTEYYIKRISLPEGDRLLTAISFKILPDPVPMPSQVTFVLPWTYPITISPFKVDMTAFQELEESTIAQTSSSMFRKLFLPLAPLGSLIPSLSLSSSWMTLPTLPKLPRLPQTIPNFLKLPDIPNWFSSKRVASFRSCSWQLHSTADEITQPSKCFATDGLAVSAERRRLLASAYEDNVQVVTCTFSPEPCTEPYRLPPFVVVSRLSPTSPYCPQPFLPGLQYPETSDYLPNWNTIIYSEDVTGVLKTHTGKEIHCNTADIFVYKELVHGQGPSQKVKMYHIDGHHPNADLVIT